MIHDKPFNYDEYIRRVIFLGRPNFFNARDLNKELMVLHKFIEDSNEKFAVSSDLNFSFTSFSELVDTSVTPNLNRRSFTIAWDSGTVLFKGVRLNIVGGSLNATHDYPVTVPSTPIVPRACTYIILRASKELVTYAQDPILCGITSDETPTSAPSVNVEQMKNVTIGFSTDLEVEEDLFCVLGVLHPVYEMGTTNFTNMGFMKTYFTNPTISLDNGSKVGKSTFFGNGSLFEHVTEVFSRWKKVINERQLARRFNLSDIENPAKARKNLGFDKVVNHAQLVKDENLKDLPNKATARYNLGLSPLAVANFGTGLNDVMRGNAIAVGMVMMFSGDKKNIPQGWVICDGSQGTPDLRARFVVGVDDAQNEYKLGVSGGLEKVKLTSAQSGVPPHRHEISDPGHVHKYEKAAKGRGYQTRNDDTPYSVDTESSTASAKTGVSVSNSTALDASESHENRPPYYALYFIMYIGYTPTTVPVVPPTQPTLDYPNYSVPDADSNGGYVAGDYTETNTDLGNGIILTNVE